MKESKVRDLLINQLEIFESGLEFLDKEKYLPNVEGTRSFIDILAKDRQGKFVIIEVKRANASSRQAIHELLKYVEAIKENKSLKEDELRLMVVSTVWNELLIPFSSFVQRVNLDTKGFQIDFLADKKTYKAIEVSIVPVTENRLISNSHAVRYYYTEESLNNGIKEHENSFDVLGVRDYVLFVLEAPENYLDMVKASIGYSRDLMNEKLGSYEKNNQFMSKIDEHYNYKFMIYSGNTLLTDHEYSDILSKNYEYPEVFDETMEDESRPKLDKLEELNAMLTECEPFPDADYTEIGYPAKFENILDEQKWKIRDVHRYGRLKDNELLKDEVLVREFRGSAGTTKQKYKSELDFDSKANINRVIDEIDFCLSDNIVWKNHILSIINELKKETAIVKSSCIISNPMNVIYTIHLSTTRPNGIEFLPLYELIVEKENQRDTYLGYLGYKKKKEFSLNEIWDTFFDGSPTMFFYSLIWGGYDENNLKICEELGLEYKTIKIVERDEQFQFYKFENYTFNKVDELYPLGELEQFIDENEGFVEEINDLFEENHLGNGVYSI
ncbi:MAG: endonuclease NucS [bacterium]|nr:endonuclease NucS [bacterium]